MLRGIKGANEVVTDCNLQGLKGERYFALLSMTKKRRERHTSMVYRSPISVTQMSCELLLRMCLFSFCKYTNYMLASETMRVFFVYVLVVLITDGRG